MSDSTPVTPSEYEPPSIDGRDPIALPLIGNASLPPAQSAAFRPEMAGPYVAPRIVERAAIDGPLVGVISGAIP